MPAAAAPNLCVYGEPRHTFHFPLFRESPSKSAQVNTILTRPFRFVSAAPYFGGDADPLSSDAGSLLGGVGFLHVRPSAISPSNSIVFVFGQRPESSLVSMKGESSDVSSARCASIPSRHHPPYDCSESLGGQTSRIEDASLPLFLVHLPALVNLNYLASRR